MSKENFLLVSLEEPQARQLAEVLSNETSRRIINFLTENKDATESTLAKALNLPLPTIHYNLKKLKESQLVSVDEFHYSVKGREVDHYRLANKYVIITPKPVTGIKTHLRNILPVSFILAAVAGAIHFIQRFTAPLTKNTDLTQAIDTTVAEVAFEQTVRKTTESAVEDSVVAATHYSVSQPDVAVSVAQSSQFSPAVWFLFGGILVLLLIFLFSFVRSRFKNLKNS